LIKKKFNEAFFSVIQIAKPAWVFHDRLASHETARSRADHSTI